MKKSFPLAILCGVMLLATACKKSFFETPPQDALSLENYYKTDDQVKAATNALYNSPWFDWNNKSSWCISELLSGNGHTYSSDVINFGNFSVTADNNQLLSAWNAMFTVVSQSNAILNNLPVYVSPAVNSAVLKNALGEAHFMRGVAYFNLVRCWGNVPIVENSLAYTSNYKVNTNPVTDIYKFIINDLKFAEANCTAMVRTGSTSQGHVSSGSASAMLAKIYLYRQNYDSARYYAEKVINSGEFKLYGIDISGKTYADLYKTANNNNEECIAAMQWLGGSAYGHGNSRQAYFSWTTAITGTGDGYGTMTGSIDLQTAYEAGDLRRKSTLMYPGDHYDEIDQANGGYTVPANAASQGSQALIKKYVVGTPADNGGKGGFMSAANNTYIMRYADILLIEAEAVLAGAASTSDPAALVPFNNIRKRAGLIPKTAITQNDIWHERRMEFAMEDDYWFDLCRMDGFNASTHPKAIAVISNQERGIYSTTIPVVVWTQKYTPTDANFLLPYPTSESILNPLLLAAPVPYHF